MRYEYLLPTSDPDLFVTQEGKLLHRISGPLNIGVARHGPLLMLPNMTPLQVHWDAPQVEIDVDRETGSRSGLARSEIGSVVEIITGFVGNASNYLTVVTTAIEVLDLLMGAVDQTEVRLASIDRQLHDISVQIGAADYLNLLRRMADMRGNALAVVQTLDAIRTLVAGSPPETWYLKMLRDHDAQLQRDINALLDPAAGYFYRPYAEYLIKGDGFWMEFIPDRPVTGEGTTLDYRVALPTVALLIAVRLTMMKFVVPDFVSRHTFSAEILNWANGLSRIESAITNNVRTTKPLPIEVQCARRQANGNQRIGEFQNWHQHCTIGAPYSISPIGAVDISTGVGFFNWDYVHFDEWYLGQGSASPSCRDSGFHPDLRGGTAGYWPPSVGPQYYNPPPQATGLPPYDWSIGVYYWQAQNDANGLFHEVRRYLTPAWATIDLKNQCMRLVYPDNPLL